MRRFLPGHAAAEERWRRQPSAKSPVALSQATRWGTKWCWPDPRRETELPIDDADMGCDCTPQCEIRGPWTRQVSLIEIAEPDAISDDGQEVYNLLAARGFDNILIAGVHLNMCVLGRSFAIRQMVTLGKNVVLVRDLTDTMYNSRMRPFVTHFKGPTWSSSTSSAAGAPRSRAPISWGASRSGLPNRAARNSSEAWPMSSPQSAVAGCRLRWGMLRALPAHPDGPEPAACRWARSNLDASPTTS